jgi:Zn-finger protein
MLANRKNAHAFDLMCLLFAALLAINPTSVQAEGDGPLTTGSGRPYVHRIALYDHEGRVIDPTKEGAPPFSAEQTCGKCHDVNSIAHGWHFNAGLDGSKKGRQGEPWLYWEDESDTLIPLSYRKWKGTWSPDEVEISRWLFVQKFGRHLPGGGIALKPETDDHDSENWERGGSLEIDCLACHDASAYYDPAQRAEQIERGNLKYVPTAASGLGIVRGSVEDAAEEDADPFAAFDPAFEESGAADTQSLQIDYQISRFDADNRVTFDITRDIPDQNCYACHTNRYFDADQDNAAWHHDEDVHLMAGMSCVSCHRNGIDHEIVRGFKEERPEHLPTATLSCQGCHYGVADSLGVIGEKAGRLGAPFPEHRGLPPVHFEKMSCTACHSGPIPEESLKKIQTSMSHGLGLARFGRDATEGPSIAGPVLLRGSDGLIAPHKVVWPSYYGYREGEGDVTPIPPTEIVELIISEEIINVEKGPERVKLTLESLENEAPENSRAAFVAGGLVHQLDAKGELKSEKHVTSMRYEWRLAHNVRPASQSLGARGCQECHSTSAPSLFASINARTPVKGLATLNFKAAELQGLDLQYQKRFAQSFAFRPLFKWSLILGLLIIGVGLLLCFVTTMQGTRIIKSGKIKKRGRK